MGSGGTPPEKCFVDKKGLFRGVKTLYCGGGGWGHTGALAPPVYMLKKGSGLVFRTFCTVFCIKIEA